MPDAMHRDRTGKEKLRAHAAVHRRIQQNNRADDVVLREDVRRVNRPVDVGFRCKVDNRPRLITLKDCVQVAR